MKRKLLALLAVLVAPIMMVWAQEMNRKYSMTTQMFLNELQEQAEQQASGVRRAPAHTQLPQPERLIASPDTVDGVAYISCFIHLKDASDLNAVSALGVKVQETFDGLDFITASVPVAQLEPLAGVDNVTCIKVAQLMRPLTDAARQLTNVDDLLTQSVSALSLGVNSLFDGTGVVLGIIDTGIDFQHIAFKDKNGHSRIKRAYVYDGTSTTGVEYSDVSNLTTDDATMDHGTHTASTAGGSSVIINKNDNNNFTITVTDGHANATYGGMAPGADLYLAGVKGLKDAELANAINKMVAYADAVKKPLVVSNSWGSRWGTHDGTGELATLISQHFGDSHPNHIILFSSANEAGHSIGSNEGGGYFVKKSGASSTEPLGTIIRTSSKGGDYYGGPMACAWSGSKMNCKLYVLDNSGSIKSSWTVTETTSTFSGLDTYYTGSLLVTISVENGKHSLSFKSSAGITSTSEGTYTLAIEVYPESGSADINLWAGSATYLANHLTTEGHSWTAGTDDMCVSDETTIPDAISVGAYMSKTSWKNNKGNSFHFTVSNELGDIAYFSSYATAAQSPTGKAYPWITAPGSALVAGVNHFHTTTVDDESFFNEKKSEKGSPFLVVNNTYNPYGVMQGTSMATPVAAGIVALWLQAAQSVNKNLTVNDVKNIMALTAIQDAFTTTGTNASHFGQGKIDALAGIRYILTGSLEQLPDFSLPNDGSNSSAITSVPANGKACNVTLTGRTLYKDGAWNTLCLPFDVSIATGPLCGDKVKAMKLNSSQCNLNNGTLTLNFSNVTFIPAGTPFIIKWDESGTDLTSPVFNGVTVTNTPAASVSFTGGSFVGSYSPVAFEANDNSKLYLGAENKLFWPETSMTLNAFRAYFQLDNPNAVRSFHMNFGEEEMGISSFISNLFVTGEEVWYTLDGRRLQDRPTARGIYINNGRKVVIK